MPLDISGLHENIRRGLDVYRTLGKPEHAGDLIIDYRPYGQTIEGRVNAAGMVDTEEYKQLTLFNLEELVNTVVKWDLLNKGEVVPLTVEGIFQARVPAEVIDEIVEAIRKDRNPGERSGRRR